MQIWVLKAGLQYGPYSQEALREQIERGVFTGKDFASYEDTITWLPINEVPGMSSNVFAVETDRENNLLVIRYYGRIDPAIVERCLLRVRTALEEMEPGFELLADFTELESMDPACIPYVEKIMRLCNEKGVSAIVRVIPDPKRDIGLQIMSHFHYDPNVRIMTCPIMDEAMARLSV
jgi:hypothetical protein